STTVTFVHLAGIDLQLRSSGELCATDNGDALPDYGPWMCASVAGQTDVTVRVQRDTAAKRFRYEVYSTGTQAPVTAYCGTVQVTWNGNLFPCPIGTLYTRSWAGTYAIGGSGVSASLAYLKWYSTLVTPGTVPNELTAGDLADFRFENNLANSATSGVVLSAT